MTLPGLAALVLLALCLFAGCGGNGIHRLPGLRGDCEDVRLRCVKRCENKYQSSLGEMEYCTQRCNWEYRTCTD